MENIDKVVVLCAASSKFAVVNKLYLANGLMINLRASALKLVQQ
jgi:hypothetical protein